MKLRLHALAAVILCWLAGPLLAQQPADPFPPVNYVGHLHPDTDAICSAIGAAALFGGTPVRVGELNRETAFVVKEFGLESPKLLADPRDFANRQFVLVDHNQREHAAEQITGESVLGIIDHHALREQPLSAEGPIRIDIRPWGSTCTIVAFYYFEGHRQVSKPIAGALLSGILSDTLAFRSPTTTEFDRRAVARLAPLAGVEDVNGYAKRMFEAKSDLQDLGAEQLLLADYKQYQIGGKRIGFGVAETLAPDDVIARKQELLDAMEVVKQQRELDLLFFNVVDIFNQRSSLLILGDAERKTAARAYGRKPKDGWIELRDIVSRKRQLIPELEKVLAADAQ